MHRLYNHNILKVNKVSKSTSVSNYTFQNLIHDSNG